MKTKILWACIVVVLVLLGAYLAFGRTAPEPSDTALSDTQVQPGSNIGTEPAPNEATAENAKTWTVTLTEEGFSPATLAISKGDTVTFVNQSNHEMWVGADAHPTHTNYDGTATNQHCVSGKTTGGSFDECTRAKKGVSWSFAFTKSGSFDYHNHTKSSERGSVVVK